MRKLAVLTTAVLLSACTPQQRFLLGWLSRPPERPVPCSQWAGADRLAGFTETELPTMLTLEWRESHCQPWAVGPSDDWGKAQIHGSWVGALCAARIACTRAELLNPQTNARAARYVFERQGWTAWATYGG